MSRLLLISFFTTATLFACADKYGTTQNPITEQGDCTLTQGYWKNHPTEWPVTSLALGNRTYSEAEALQVLGTPVSGNGLLSLAHQLIAAKLNVASGASDTAGTAIAQADAMIGNLVLPPIGAGYLAPSTTAPLAQALDDYNTGKTGPGHCGDVGKPECTCGDGVVHAPEQCDDGNTVDGDGCSSICRIEGLQ
jgi:cysteine-rich repeat protein